MASNPFVRSPKFANLSFFAFQMATLKYALLVILVLFTICSSQVFARPTRKTNSTSEPKLTPEQHVNPVTPARPPVPKIELTTKGHGISVGVLVAVFVALVFIIAVSMVAIYCRYYRQSSDSGASIKAMASGASGASRGKAGKRDGDVDYERMSIKTKRSKGSKGRSGAGRGSLKRRMISPKKAASKGKTKGKRKRSNNSKGTRRSPKGNLRGPSNMSRGKTASKNKTRRSKGISKGKCGEQTMLYKDSMQFYKEFLKSVHSVKSVSQYFAPK